MGMTENEMEQQSLAQKEDSKPTNGIAPAAPESKAIVPAESTPVGGSSPGALSVFQSEGNFVSAQRMAKALAASTLMPDAYRNNIPNVLIAMELASRIGASVLMVAQNLYVVHGRPGWSAQFLIATVNASGRFTPLRFTFTGERGKPSWGCFAHAKDRSTGELCEGAEITLALAKAEGWTEKKGSKWLTMPQQMLMYRAAAFWTRVYAPELALGIHTHEEVVDTIGVEMPEGAELPGSITPGSPAELEAALRGEREVVAEFENEGEERQPGED